MLRANSTYFLMCMNQLKLFSSMQTFWLASIPYGTPQPRGHPALQARQLEIQQLQGSPLL